jgi:hypothetical protein
MTETFRTVAPFGLLVLLVAFVLWRNRRPRRLRINRLWIIPTLVTLGVGVGVALGRPPIGYHWVDIALSLLAVALGLAAGWRRGKFMRIAVDPDTSTVTAHASPAGVLFILGLLAVRRALQFEVETGAIPLPFKPAALIEPLLYFAAATVVAQRLEMWLRARRLLAEAPAGRVEPSAASALSPDV